MGCYIWATVLVSPQPHSDNTVYIPDIYHCSWAPSLASSLMQKAFQALQSDVKRMEHIIQIIKRPSFFYPLLSLHSLSSLSFSLSLPLPVSNFSLWKGERMGGSEVNIANWSQFPGEKIKKRKMREGVGGREREGLQTSAKVVQTEDPIQQ